jgi:alpha-D-xyloside xylohydrolase
VINKKPLIQLLLITFAFGCAQTEHERSLSLTWEEKAGGVWRCEIGTEEEFDLLDAAGVQPKFDALQKKPAVNFPLDKSLINATWLNGKLYLRFPLDDDEQIYGLGLQFKDVNRRGKVYQLHVDHYGGKDNGRTHAPAPFYVSSKGYGVLINSARYITVYVGTTVRIDSPNQPEVRDRNTDKNWTSRPKSDAVEILVPAQGAEVLVFGGESPLDAVSRYNLYCGGGSLPPKWGLGFTYRTHRLHSDRDVIAEVKAFDENQFPLDFIGLEPGWQSASYPCTYEWDSGRFPQPEKFVQELLQMNVRTNLWLNPYVSPKASLYEKLLPFAGSHSVWTGIVPDYSISEAQRIFMQHFEKHQLDIGVSGVKIDEADGYDHWLWPDVATFPSAVDAEQLRQTYGLILQRMFAESYRKRNIRTFGLTRASNAGAAHLPFVIYNDSYSHEDFITALVNSSFNGILWTPEVRSSETGEEWLRRMQSVCFSPMAMINAWASGTRPWSFPEVYDAVKAVANLRMRLLPYIYSTFAEYHFRGTPPIRAIALIENFDQSEVVEQNNLDDTKNPYEEAVRKDIKDQFMLGDNLLVAPMFSGQKSRKVILPSGKWFDFYTGNFVGEREIIEVSPGIEKIPLFVRDGGIIPMIPSRLHTPKNGEILPLEIRHYGKSPGKFLLYDDDGETYDYESGAHSWTELTVVSTPEGDLRGEVKRLDNNIYNYGKAEWVFRTEAER